ncbi:MAG: TraR/DksA family transcriptional regulator [Gemmatimonadetes bacterium]|nr:TraR/DksA family transcriptional regulator [Gemmatimonadota bacterium]
MPPLDANEIAVLRAELDRQLGRLERSMAVTDAALEPIKLDQTAVGRLSRIDSLQNQGLTRNLQEREQVKLAQIQDALRRLSEGTYGRCVSCSGEIGFNRLYVMPEAAVCASCGDSG